MEKSFIEKYGEYEKYYTEEDDFNNKLSRSHKFLTKDFILNLFILIDRLKINKSKSIAKMALGYFIYPFDFIPDFLMGPGGSIGFMDDMACVTIACSIIVIPNTAIINAKQNFKKFFNKS